MRATSGVCVGLCLAFGAARTLDAQTGAAVLAGMVRDQSAMGVPGAQVTLTHTATGQVRVVLTDAGGSYAAAGLLPGAYLVRVVSDGLQPVDRSIDLEPEAIARLDVTAIVVPVTETVAVRADVGVLHARRATRGQVVDERRVVDLPLNGRTFVALVALAPGAALPPGSQLPRINGGRPRVNEYLYDGLSVLQPEPGQVAYVPVIDAIQELTVQSNSPPAEFGRFNGGVVTLLTKSGSNEFRGTLFDFLRHEALNARNALAPGGQAKPRFRRHQPGGVLGGPIRRGRTFFFVDYQAQQQSIGRTVVSTVPTPLQRQGIFTEPVGGRAPAIYDPATTVTAGGATTRRPFPGNVISSDRFDPVARALLDRYPTPTSGGTANNYRRVADERSDQQQFGIRMDQRAAMGAQFFSRLSHARETFRPVTLGPQVTKAWAAASAFQHAIRGRVFNEVRLGDARRSVRRRATALAGPVTAALGLPGIPAAASFPSVLPTFLITGYQQLGSPPNASADFDTSVTHLVDMLTWTTGRHTIKSGMEFRWSRLNVLQPPSPTGSFQFTSLFTDLPGAVGTGSPLASFLLGQVQTFSIDVQQRQIRNRARAQEYFVQDDWRATERMTVNAGLRYTLNFPSIEQNGQAAVFDVQAMKIEYLGRDGNPRSARALETGNVAPRLGVVGQVTNTTVVRAGYGLVWIEQAGITTPFTTPHFPFLQSVSQRTLDGLSPAFVLADGPTVAPIPLSPDAGLGQGVFAVNRHRGSGYAQQWHVSLQRAVSTNTSVDVAYVGSRITRAGVPDANVNQLSVSQLGLGPALLERVPNPYVGFIPRASSLGDQTIPLAQLMKPFPQYAAVSFYRDNVGVTVYRGLEMRFERRASGGLSLQASYTISRLIDDASSVFDAAILTGPVANAPVADSFNRALERDYSTGDIPHVLVSSTIWDLPMGAGRRWRPSGVWGALVSDWTLTAIATMQSGMPIAVTQAVNFNAFAGFGVQRPNLVADPDLPAGERSVGRWFNTDAFATAPQFTLGSSSRNPVRGPGYRNLDLAVIRRVRLSGGAILEVRGEMFNATNTPPLGSPNGVLGSAAFGTITSAGDPRVVQLGLKIHF